MSSIGKLHPYYARTYMQHIVRSDGSVVVHRGVPFTELHAAEAGEISRLSGGVMHLQPPRPGVHDGGLPLFAATNLVESWNRRFDEVRNHFPRFFYTVE